MNNPLKIVQLETTAALDIAGALRNLADSIEAGEFGDAHNVAWVIDCGAGRIEVGLLGKAPEPGATGYFLFGLAKRELENSAVEGAS